MFLQIIYLEELLVLPHPLSPNEHILSYFSLEREVQNQPRLIPRLENSVNTHAHKTQVDKFFLEERILSVVSQDSH